MPRFCANLSLMYGEAPFLDRFALAAADGFKGVEFLFPYAFPADEVARRLKAHGLGQVLFNLPPGDWEGGERGLACRPDRRDEFARGLDLALSYAGLLGCPRLHCMAGLVPDGLPVAEARAAFVANLRFAAGAARKAGLVLLIEPINPYDMPGYFLQTMDQAAEIAAEVGADNLFLQYDLYHRQRGGGELAATYLRHKARIAHVQVADNPGRHEPGTGEVGWPFLFALLDREGYDGWVGCEYQPREGTRAGLGWVRPFLDAG
ncbi:MAG: hydroxypyruvate isomerase [Geminicoccaceae bacterium]|nr:hydroxypyruvate isomerase [Geminicoccaceae bacterium]